MKTPTGCFASIAILLLFRSISWAEVPLPSDMTIVLPDAGLGKELAAFSGKWAGNWSGRMDAMLIVEQIGTEKAKVIYAWGDVPQWNFSKGYSRYLATVIPAEKTLEFRTSVSTLRVEITGDLTTVRVTRLAFADRASGTQIVTFTKVAP
jgi:hypothetical protein